MPSSSLPMLISASFITPLFRQLYSSGILIFYQLSFHFIFLHILSVIRFLSLFPDFVSIPDSSSSSLCLSSYHPYNSSLLSSFSAISFSDVSLPISVDSRNFRMAGVFFRSAKIYSVPL
jgi:hypothetical protein